jgi:thioredoxin 1
LWRWFWRITLVVSLGYAWYCYYVPNNEIAWAADYPAAVQRTAQSGKPMVLFFTGKWCVPCRIMKRTVWADEEVEAVVNAGFTPLLIDVGEPGSSSEALERYQVHMTPTTIIADADGKVLEQVHGAMSKLEFLALLEGKGSGAEMVD